MYQADKLPLYLHLYLIFHLSMLLIMYVYIHVYSIIVTLKSTEIQRSHNFQELKHTFSTKTDSFNGNCKKAASKKCLLDKMG